MRPAPSAPAPATADHAPSPSLALPAALLPAPEAPASPATMPAGLGDALREQGRLLTAADALLRDLGVRANELVAAAREAGREASAPHEGQPPALDTALRDIERLARDQSAGAATLGSRLAQLLVRQSDLDAALRRTPHASTDVLAASDVTPLWPPAGSSSSHSGTGAGVSAARHALAWESSPSVPSVVRVASGPLR